MTMDDRERIVAGLVQELRRGTLILCVLRQLGDNRYGYSLVQSLEEAGIPIDPGTLYPLLRRLEKQGLLESRWELEEARPRRYYGLSETGAWVLDRLTAEWQAMVRTIRALVDAEPDTQPKKEE